MFSVLTAEPIRLFRIGVGMCVSASDSPSILAWCLWLLAVGVGQLPDRVEAADLSFAIDSGAVEILAAPAFELGSSVALRGGLGVEIDDSFSLVPELIISYTRSTVGDRRMMPGFVGVSIVGVAVALGTRFSFGSHEFGLVASAGIDQFEWDLQDRGDAGFFLSKNVGSAEAAARLRYAYLLAGPVALGAFCGLHWASPGIRHYFNLEPVTWVQPGLFLEFRVP